MLRPEDPASSETWTPTGPIPAGVRSFGKFPNIAEWLPGDLLLVSELEPGFIARQIRAAQVRGGFSEQQSQWQHAAVYMGESTVLEATRSGVGYADLFEYVGHYNLLLRRGAGLSSDERWRLALQAGFRLRENYGFSTIGSLLKMSFSGFWRTREPLKMLPDSAVICSQLYSDAFTAVSGSILAPPIVTPAALAATAKLQDVPLRWLKIGS